MNDVSQPAKVRPLFRVISLLLAGVFLWAGGDILLSRVVRGAFELDSGGKFSIASLVVGVVFLVAAVRGKLTEWFR